MRIVVDRVEGDRAILEIAGVIVDVPRGVLPEGAREGSVLRLQLDEARSEAEILEAGRERLARLAARGPKSDDIEL